LDFWINANQYAIKRGKNILGDRFYVVNFDRLCTFPFEEINGLAQFIGLELSDDRSRELATLVKTPGTMGSFRTKDFQKIFDHKKIQVVKNMGFSVEPG